MKPLKAVTSHTILDFFEAKPQQRGKKRGYLIIRKIYLMATKFQNKPFIDPIQKCRQTCLSNKEHLIFIIRGCHSMVSPVFLFH